MENQPSPPNEPADNAGVGGSGGESVETAAARAWFRAARFGMFIHFGLYSIPARGEWVQSWEKIPHETYRHYFDAFHPTRYDPRAWARLARRAGMKYAVMTAKHHDGFCLWDSALTDYKSTRTRGGHDLIRMYVDAFRDEGLKVGIYYSLLDWHHPHYTLDRHHPLRELPAESPERTTRDFPKYLEYMHAQVRELLSNYGTIDLLWFDFSFDDKRGEAWRAADLVKMVRDLQPGILLNNRLAGAHEYFDPNRLAGLGDIDTPEQVIPTEREVTAWEKGGKGPALWEAAITLNDHWGYKADDRNFKTPAQCIRLLVECVSKGGNLLLNVGPTALGEIQPEAVDILEAIATWMQPNAESIWSAGRALGMPKPEWGRYTQKATTLYAHLFERPAGPLVIEGLAGKVRRAAFLADAAELPLARPWNVQQDSPDLHISLPRAPLRDPADTVIALDLA